MRPAQSASIAVAVVDDDADTRCLVQDILSAANGLACAGAYTSGEEAIAGAMRVRPEAVLMDVHLPGMSGIECARRLKMLVPGLVVVLITGFLEMGIVAQGLDAACDGFLSKPFGPVECVAAVLFALRRRRRGTGTPAWRALPRLTTRQTEVIECLARGLLYKEIAHHLGISYSAVHKHQQRIFEKLDVENRTEAVLRWQQQRGGD